MFDLRLVCMKALESLFSILLFCCTFKWAETSIYIYNVLNRGRATRQAALINILKLEKVLFEVCILQYFLQKPFLTILNGRYIGPIYIAFENSCPVDGPILRQWVTLIVKSCPVMPWDSEVFQSFINNFC